MRFFLSAIPFAACALAAVLAEPAEPINLTERDAALDELAPRDNGFKINYYTDGGCTDYLVSMYVCSRAIYSTFRYLLGSIAPEMCLE